MATATRGHWRTIWLTVFCLTAGRAAADHVNTDGFMGLGYSTNPRIRHGENIKAERSTWAAKRSPTVEIFVLNAASSPTQSNAVPASPVATTEKKAAEPTENAKPTPQPRPRLKGADTMDAHALIGSRDQSAVELSPKGREFFQKFAADIEARCALAMTRDKIEPVEGMTVRYIIEINTHDGKIAVKELNYPSQVGTAEFFLGIIQDMSPLAQPDPEVSKTLGEVVRIEVRLT